MFYSNGFCVHLHPVINKYLLLRTVLGPAPYVWGVVALAAVLLLSRLAAVPTRVGLRGARPTPEGPL